MAPNLCRVLWPYLPRILPYCWLSWCTFYATLLPHCFADAAVIRNYRDNHTYSQNILCQQTPYWTKVNRTWFWPRMRPKSTELNQTEPNRKRVWPVKITPLMSPFFDIVPTLPVAQYHLLKRRFKGSFTNLINTLNTASYSYRVTIDLLHCHACFPCCFIT